MVVGVLRVMVVVVVLVMMMMAMVAAILMRDVCSGDDSST